MSIKNGEIIFTYEAKLTNPNGDIDDENRPRMDYQTLTNLVSDVRLKRYIRDYMLDQGKEIFINHDPNVQTATERLTESMENIGIKDLKKDFERLKDFIDIRMFGAMVPIKGDKDAGNSNDSVKIVGPVQFSWGYSLNAVELLNSYSITGGFASKIGNKNSSIGKDYRLYYSLISFYGIINGKRAEKSGLSENDMEALDDALINAIPEQASRSKIGQTPLFYLRTISDKYVGDMRDYIKLKSINNPIRNISDYSLDISALKNVLETKNIQIGKYWKSNLLNTNNINF